MAAQAFLLLEDMNVQDGLDVARASELWHVTGITEWPPDKTLTNVYSVIPVAVGSVHRELKSALCVSIGPARKINKSDGTYEALVPVQYDSNRRFGGAGRLLSGMSGAGELLMRGYMWQAVPYQYLTNPDAGVGNEVFETRFNYEFFDPEIRRQIVRVMEPRITGEILTSTKDYILAQVGKPFRYPGGLVTYIMKCPTIYRMRTGATSLTYIFETTTPMQSIDAGIIPGYDIDLPYLAPLDEYVPTRDENDPSKPAIGVLDSETRYGTPDNMAGLPFWDAPS